MGGHGIGRGKSGKATTTSALELDVRELQRSSLILQAAQTAKVSWLVGGVNVAKPDLHARPDGVQLTYWRERRQYGWAQIEQQVKLEPTACMFGEQRYWFRCPATGCARRVAKLYLGGSGGFACRHCCRLVYESRRESKDIWAIRRADRIQKRLGWGREY